MIEEVGSNSKGETSVICTKGRYAILCRKLEEDAIRKRVKKRQVWKLGVHLIRRSLRK
jgi:hypothetical protein